MILVHNFVFQLRKNADLNNNRERKEYNLLIFSIMIIPLIQSTAAVMLKLNNITSITIDDTFLFLLIVIISLAVAVVLKEKDIL